MRTLANNMAWLLKCINAGKKAGIELPKNETIVRTNFIKQLAICVWKNVKIELKTSNPDVVKV